MLAIASCALAFHLPLVPSTPPAAARLCPSSPCVMQDVRAERAADVAIAWRKTEPRGRDGEGWKYVEETVGEGEVAQPEDLLQVHYTVTLLGSGTTLGSSRGRDGKGRPLTVCLGKHDVPIWDEALVGMRIGGRRRMLVPQEAAPERSQAAKVPGENRVLRFDFEIVGALDKESFAGKVASTLPPYARQVEIGRNLYMALWLLSFVPYFLPMNMQPNWYHDGMTPQEISERREQREMSRYLGGDISSIDGLFP